MLNRLLLFLLTRSLTEMLLSCAPLNCTASKNACHHVVGVSTRLGRSLLSLEMGSMWENVDNKIKKSLEEGVIPERADFEYISRFLSVECIVTRLLCS